MFGVFELLVNKASHNTVASLVVDQGGDVQPRQGNSGESLPLRRWWGQVAIFLNRMLYGNHGFDIFFKTRKSSLTVLCYFFYNMHVFLKQVLYPVVIC
jgi:hypothetical protein